MNIIDIKRIGDLRSKHLSKVLSEIRFGTLSIAALKYRYKKEISYEAVQAETNARALAELRAYKGN